MAERNKIFFQISSIKLISFHQYIIEDLDENKPAQINIGAKFGINKEKSLIATFIKTDFSQDDKEFLGIEVAHNFKLKDNSVLDNCTPEELKLPLTFLRTIVGISISGTRGLLAGINTNRPFNRFLIPLVNPKYLVLDNRVMVNSEHSDTKKSSGHIKQ